MTLLEAALQYDECGWFVVPLHTAEGGRCSCIKGARCASPGKHTLVRWKNLERPDTRQIEKWWCRWPQANVGILTGMRSGVGVLDIDGEAGAAQLAKLVAALGAPLPRTLMAESGRVGGGRHAYYAVSERTRNATANGLDWRGDGGLVVAPPSLHKSGATYKWLEGPLAALPAGVMEWFEKNGGGKRKPRKQAARADLPDHLKGFTRDTARAARVGGVAALADIEAALAAIPNLDLGWEEWNTVLMTIWASGGTLEMADAWSRKSKKHEPAAVEERWGAYASCPPTELSFGSLVYRARQVEPDWMPPSMQIRASSAKKRERKQTTWAMLKRDWVYVDNQEVFIKRDDPKVLMYTVRGFNNKFAYLKRDLEVKGSLANYIFSRQPGRGLDTFEAFCYMPGQPENFKGDLNLWRQSLIVPKQGDGRWFIDHLEWLFGADSEHVPNWCAWVYCFQHLHPKHALLTHGEIQGTGKSVVANAMKRLLGPRNCTILDQSALDLAPDGWKVSTKLIVIEEVRPAFGSNNALAKKLHPLISEDTVHVDMKNRNDFDMPNVMAVLCGSNKPDAITMDDSDRRYLIVSTDRDGKTLRPKPREYYRALYGKDGVGGKLDDPDALAAVAWELQHRNLKGYSAQDPAPNTAAKARMIEAAGSDLQRWMLDSDVTCGHKLITVDCIAHQVPFDIDRRHRGNLRTDIADILRRKFAGVQVRNQIRPNGSNGSKLRVWALGSDAEKTAALLADKLAEIWRAEYHPRAPG